MKRIVTALAFGVSLPALSQTDADALRFSMIDYLGSARFVGAGSAFTALGADHSAIALNPASIGQFRASEIAFTPGFHVASTESAFLSTHTADARVNFNVSSFGLVLSRSAGGSGRSPKAPWETFNWSVGYNRMANYNDRYTMSGVNPDNSLVDRFVEEANGTFADDLDDYFPFGAGLAYGAGLLAPNPDSISYASRTAGAVSQTRTVESRGANDEWSFAFGGNISDKVMVGAAVGLPSIDYLEEWTHNESDHADTIPGFSSFEQYYYLRTRGSGINGKVGITALLGRMFRIGAAFHSPSLVGLRDGYYTFVENEGAADQPESPLGSYRYSLRTPWRAHVGAAVILKQYGFVSVDYEYVDYSGMAFNFRNEQAYEDLVNQVIADKYGPASNIRVGGELVLQAYRVRAGAQFIGSPFQDGVAPEGGDYSRTSFSGGVGYRGKSFFADLAYVLTTTGQSYVPYTLSDPNEIIHGALIDKALHSIVVTMGFRMR